MSKQRVDRVSARIDEELARFSRTPFEAGIFRVDDLLRRENEKAYTPEILAIGPYHHGKEKLQKMEEHKLRYLQLLLERRNESSVHRYVMALRELEERARRCYAESTGLEKDEFVQMLLLDGFFIIELFRKFKMPLLIDEHDPVFRSLRTICVIPCDLLLFENQLPFFILAELWDMTNLPGPQVNIIDIALNFFTRNLPFQQALNPSNAISIGNVKHLLGLVHDSLCSSFAKIVQSRPGRYWEFIKSATELREAGIKFKKATESSSLLDIKFENGIMKIPVLSIGDHAEIFLRNLTAYEQYRLSNEPAYVTDYRKFLDCLINSAKDVEKLRHYGIIDNWLGDDESVATMINKLGDSIFLNAETFCYSEVFNEVNNYCGQRWPKWMANLRHNYFHSPWAFISFLGAIMLLLLTMAQTIFSILSYYKESDTTWTK